jgi:PAS domain S-box-containing protein
MTGSPTYQELEQRVQALARQAAELKRAQEALQESEEFSSSLLTNLPNPMIVINPDSSVRYVNHSLEKLTGFSSAELVGRKAPYPWLPEETLQKTSKDLEEAMLNGAKGLEALFQKKNGEPFWVEISCTPMRSDAGPKYCVANWVEATDRKEAEEALRKSRQKLAGIVASVPDHMSMIDNEHNIVWTNDVARELFGPDLVGKKCYGSYHGYDKPCEPCILKNCFEDGKVHEQESLVTTWKGKQIIFWCMASPAAWHKDGRPKLVVEISRDITRRKHAEEALRKAHDVMEQRIKRRTAKLTKTTERLKVELTERKRAEEALKEREAALHARADELKEANKALRVVLKRMDEDKKKLEKKVSLNVKGLVAPYAERLKKSGLDAKQMAYLSMLESNLNNIVSPFAHKFSSKYSGLTPSEIQTACLVKDAKTTKEIAELLSLSVRTVECHRSNIRKKIGIKNKKVSLRTQLLCFE